MLTNSSWTDPQPQCPLNMAISHVGISLWKQNMIVVGGERHRKPHRLPKWGNFTWFPFSWLLWLVCLNVCSFGALFYVKTYWKGRQNPWYTPCPTFEALEILSADNGFLPRICVWLRKRAGPWGLASTVLGRSGGQLQWEGQAHTTTAVYCCSVMLENKERTEIERKRKQKGKRKGKGEEKGKKERIS